MPPFEVPLFSHKGRNVVASILIIRLIDFIILATLFLSRVCYFTTARRGSALSTMPRLFRLLRYLELSIFFILFFLPVVSFTRRRPLILDYFPFHESIPLFRLQSFDTAPALDTPDWWEYSDEADAAYPWCTRPRLRLISISSFSHEPGLYLCRKSAIYNTNTLSSRQV